jgi:hypothetical protein
MRWARGLIIGTVFVPSGAYPAPQAKDPPDLYYPVRVGTRSVYEWHDGDRTVEVVTDVEAKDGATRVTMCEEADGKLVPVNEVAVTAREVRWIDYQGEALDRPVSLLRLPAKAGDRWDVGFATKSRRVKGTATVKGGEEVEVPAGKFKAVRVDRAVDGNELTFALWYAPGVGVVKEEFWRAGSRRDVRVLVSITAGKD